MTERRMGAAVSIRPGVGIIGLFPHMNYKPWFALAELVDNALASYLQRCADLEIATPDYQCRIEIEVSSSDGGRIRVADNAGGIGIEDYHRAFVTAEPPPDATGLSQFGVGMKSASCWFARHWSVRTSALGEPVERTVTFDVPRIVEQGLEEVRIHEQPAREGVHFTELLLWDLYKPPQSRTMTKMEDHLASMYRVFLEKGDVDIRFNDRPLVFSQPRVLVAHPYDRPDADSIEWRKPLSFSLTTGEHVSGFAGIRETASVARAGLALFRNDRLIMGSADDSYRPAEIFGASNRFRYQRIFGELHLAGFDVSHTKDGFIWGDREHEFLELLRAALDSDPLPLLRQAENYRSRTPSQTQRQAGARALDATARAVEHTGDQLEEQLAASPDQDELPEEQEPLEDIEERSLRVWVGSQAWDIAIELSNEPNIGEWVSIASTSPASERPRRLEIRVSMAHPFMLQFGGTTTDDVEPLLRVAAGIALAEVTAREAGVSMAGTVRRNLNNLLRGALARP